MIVLEPFQRYAIPKETLLCVDVTAKLCFWTRALNSHFATFAPVIIRMSGFSLTPSSSQDVLIKDGWFSETEAMWPGKHMLLFVAR